MRHRHCCRRNYRRHISKKGVITHPFETGDGSYDAGYGSGNQLNRTTKGFKTKAQAKRYLKKHHVKNALYISPEGRKQIKV